MFAFIFARKGSKRVKNKNKKLLNNKPLVQYSIEMAKRIKKIDKIFISTDDPYIKKIGIKNKCIIIDRPKSLATNNSPEWLSWRHAVNFVKEKYSINNFDFISIPTTAPLRNKEDLINCIKIFKKKKLDCLLTVAKLNHSPEYNMLYELNNKIYPYKEIKKRKLSSRKNIKSCYVITTVAYILKSNFILNKSNFFEGKIDYYVVPNERALDIDTNYDFKLASILKK